MVRKVEGTKIFLMVPVSSTFIFIYLVFIWCKFGIYSVQLDDCESNMCVWETFAPIEVFHCVSVLFFCDVYNVGNVCRGSAVSQLISKFMVWRDSGLLEHANNI